MNDDFDSAALGRNLKVARWKKNLKPAELSKMTGFRSDHILCIERGVPKVLINGETIRKLCIALNISTDFLLGMDPEIQKQNDELFKEIYIPGSKEIKKVVNGVVHVRCTYENCGEWTILDSDGVHRCLHHKKQVRHERYLKRKLKNKMNENLK